MVETVTRTSETAKRASIRVEMRPIRTYIWDKPSRYPILFGSGYRFIYPYTMEDRLLHKAVDKPYRQIVLENEYIQVIILPELGGHLWRAYDKVSGQEIFYNNHVVKPGLIALRGAWCATGVEWNFPIGHSVSSVSTVDFTCIENPDGSVTAAVGDLDRTTRMRWTVKITVFPGQLAFRVDTVLSNPSAYPGRYMYWENTAMHADDGFQFIAPAKKTWTWGGKTDFPIVDGVDKSWYIAHPRAIDYFALGLGQDYFGYYDHKRRFGAVHVADYHLMPGKKFFTWGMSDHALQWQKNLTDNEGPYIELQCGLTPTQAAFNFFPPQTSIRWDEMWFSIGDLGYFVQANREAALHLSDRLDKAPYPDEVDVALVTNRDHAGARVTVSAGGKTLLDKDGLDFHAGKPLRWKVSLPDGATVLNVRLAAAGRTILEYSTTEWRNIRELPYDNPRDLSAVDDAGPETLIAAAIANMKWFNFRKAMALIDKALAKRPSYGEARYWKGNLLYTLYRYDEALECLSKVSPRNANHATARFLSAEIHRLRGRMKDAVREARKAARAEEGAVFGKAVEARIALASGKFAKAADLLSAAAASPKAAPTTMALVAVALRRAGRAAEAAQAACAALAVDPLEFLALNELALASGASRRDEVMRGEVESYIELASYYEDAGLFDDAAAVLEHYRADIARTASPNALVLYHLAWANEKLGRSAEADAFYAAAAKSNPDMVFAFRREDVMALAAALARDASDSLAHYLLGSFFAWKLQNAEALDHFKKALADLGSYPVLLRNLGRYYLLEEGNYAEAASYYSGAIAAAPSDEELYVEADDAYAKLGDIDARVSLLRRGTKAVPSSQKIRKLLAQSYYFAGLFDESIAVLSASEFDHWEGDQMGHTLYVESYMEKGKELMRRGLFADAAACFEKAMDYPANLKVGRPAFPGHAPQLYLLGLAYEGLGDLDKARALWNEGAVEVHEGWIGRGSEPEYYKGLCLARLGRRREARSTWRYMTTVDTWHWSNTEFHDNFVKGLGFQGLEDWDKAAERFSKALSYDRTNRKVRYYLDLVASHRQGGQ